MSTAEQTTTAVEGTQRSKKESELKKLILKGKSQGFLTFAEINDHLPEDMNDTDQIEVVVNMINDMGIEVYDKAPDPDSLLLKTDNPDDEEVAEEAEAALKTAVESEFGRTTDPVRMYMREMGTVELLTREDEIRLARRIEDGIRQSTAALSICPVTIREVLAFADAYEAGNSKLTEFVVDFIDPASLDDTTVAKPKNKGDKTADDDDEEEEVVIKTGPDPEEARQRFKRMRRTYKSMERAWDKHGVASKQARKNREKLADEFLHIKVVPDLSAGLLPQVDRGQLDAAIVSEPQFPLGHLEWTPF
ncbi:MAG: RNA polymerase sigma factor region1.1 domain-containing protein, partial [Pseudomonadota bacterium]|nr:RNA polymerase sigma factor region1.1 domain-containing protein [Pseudomonadota bacterium]